MWRRDIFLARYRLVAKLIFKREKYVSDELTEHMAFVIKFFLPIIF